jgi:diaminopimelate epimerase
MKSKSVAFTKVQGTGNDFIILDAMGSSNPMALRPEYIVVMCDRNFGVGADGLIILTSTGKPNEIQWDFYNRDASSAEMCGNAARCVSEFVSQKTGTQQLTILTKAGPVAVQRLELGTHSVEMPWPLQPQALAEGTLIQTGVPHLIVQRDNFDAAVDRPFCQNLRAQLSQRGVSCNITLISNVQHDSVDVVTFERGVEDFTLSCGTGALAAGFYVGQKNNVTRVTCHLPGGELVVKQIKDEKILQLVGPATIVFQGEFYL